MGYGYINEFLSSLDTANLERILELSCGGDLETKHRLHLRNLSLTLSCSAFHQRDGEVFQGFADAHQALSNFKANLLRRKKASNTLTSSRLMEISEPARAILLSDIAYTFRGEIDNYTQIDFGDTKHLELLKAAVDSSISKVANKQGRPVNEPLDEFFIGLRDLYESATGNPAVTGAHFDGKPKTDFEKLVHLGFQIIRPAQEYQAALKAYERAISRNS